MTDNHLPMRAGQPIRVQLIYPVYADNAIVLPEKTILTGTVISLRSNHSQRVNARINGDFTPFHIPVVSFTSIILADGTSLPITTTPATDGAPILRLVAPAPRKGGFIRKQWDAGIVILKGQISVFTAPEKGDRLLQLFYHQLPYHPERIEKGTAWTVETSDPLSIPTQPESPVVATDHTPQPPTTEPQTTAIAAEKGGSPTWVIQAYLRDRLTSATAKSGEPVEAIVAEPVYNADHTIAVPQGATIIGAITQAKPARSFARAGVLGFDFKQIVLPTGQTQNVQAALTGADSASNAQLAMDSEGKVKPKPQDKVVVPLILALLATRTLDHDRDDTTSSLSGKDFVGANGFGLVGNILGLVGGAATSNIAAGIGAYGTAVSLYRRWIARGKEVTFAKDTRLVLQTTPRTAAVLKPDPR